MIKYALLQHKFSVFNLQKEVQELEGLNWKLHYNTNHFKGNWTILPLRSINGSIDNIVSVQQVALHAEMEYKNTSILKRCIHLQSVIDFFECEKLSVRLMKLGTGALIKEHADLEMSLEDGEVRFHIPIFTNQYVNFFLEDERIEMKEGECWYLNLSLKHRVENYGTSDRVHLVIDCKVNDWIINLLAKNTTLKTNFIKSESTKKFNGNDKINIIKELRLLGTKTANDLANKMENEND